MASGDCKPAFKSTHSPLQFDSGLIPGDNKSRNDADNSAACTFVFTNDAITKQHLYTEAMFPHQAQPLIVSWSLLITLRHCTPDSFIQRL